MWCSGVSRNVPRVVWCSGGTSGRERPTDVTDPSGRCNGRGGPAGLARPTGRTREERVKVVCGSVCVLCVQRRQSEQRASRAWCSGVCRVHVVVFEMCKSVLRRNTKRGVCVCVRVCACVYVRQSVRGVSVLLWCEHEKWPMVGMWCVNVVLTTRRMTGATVHVWDRSRCGMGGGVCVCVV